MASGSWNCSQCTLINAQTHANCAACGAPRPAGHSAGATETTSPRSNLLHKLKAFCTKHNTSFKDTVEGLVPSAATINSALSRIESALDVFSSTGGGAPSPRRSQMPGNWTCPKCSQVNFQSMRQCAWCTFDRSNDDSLNSWSCGHCGLQQPTPPASVKCPICKKQSHFSPASASINKISMSLPDLIAPIAHTSAQTNDENEVPQFDDDLQIASPTHSQTYRELEEFCRKNQMTFVDDSFPHSMRSVGPMNLLEEARMSQWKNHRFDAQSIVWIRPEHITTKDGFMARWSVFNDPQPSDIEQGLLGNCWFISALAVVAERPDVLERLFLTKEYNHLGIYEIRLCVDGLWRSVLVDDFFPCHCASRSMLFAVGRKNQLWVSLIEKALAKVYGSYTSLRAGRTVEGLSTLTGAPTLYIDLEEPALESATSLAHKTQAYDLIWARLLSAREAGYLMGCSCGAGRRTPNEAEFRRVGLSPRHAYSILDVRVVEDERLLRLRNPWGQFVWLGEWGWQWPGWTSSRKRAVGPKEHWRMSGTFWLPFARFVQYFDSVDIAQIHHIQQHAAPQGMSIDGWTASRYPIHVGLNDEGKPTTILRLTITEPTEVSVVLHQRNARSLLDQVDLLVLVHREGHPAAHVAREDAALLPTPGELICRSPRRTNAFSRTDDIFLAPGDYLVCAHSFARLSQGTSVSATIVVHSSRRIFSEPLFVPQSLLQRSLVELLLKEGIVEMLPPATTRYVTHDFEGLIMMVDNPMNDRCLQVHSNCSHSSNVLSSRCALSVADSIPPMHRQIVLILTHFEPSQPFDVTHQLRQRFSLQPQLNDFAPESPHSQHHPALVGASTSALHGPRFLFN